jgi:hypothetical protein
MSADRTVRIFLGPDVNESKVSIGELDITTMLVGLDLSVTAGEGTRVTLRCAEGHATTVEAILRPEAVTVEAEP